MNFLEKRRAEIAKNIYNKIVERNLESFNSSLNSTINLKENLNNSDINLESLDNTLNIFAIKNNIEMDMSNVNMTSSQPINRSGEQIIAVNLENITSWVNYFESVTQDENETDKKRLLLKVIGLKPELNTFYLNNYSSDYIKIKENLLKFRVNSDKFYPVDLKINLENKNVKEHVKDIYRSFSNRKDLPLELLKSLLPEKVRKFILNHEINDIDRLAELCQVANDQLNSIFCRFCKKSNHTEDKCWSKSKNYNNFKNKHHFKNNERFRNYNNFNHFKNNNSFKHKNKDQNRGGDVKIK
jgi:hypothetical protein